MLGSAWVGGRARTGGVEHVKVALSQGPIQAQENTVQTGKVVTNILKQESENSTGAVPLGKGKSMGFEPSHVVSKPDSIIPAL